MRFFFMTIYCRLKILLNKHFLAALIVFLLTEIFVGYIFHDVEQMSIKIGMSHTGNPAAQNLEQRFRFHAGQNIIAKYYTNTEDMKKDIIAGRLEYGYLLPDSVDKTIELYLSPNSVSEQISNLLLSSAIFESMAGELGYDIIKYYIDESSHISQANINHKNEVYLQKGKYMNLIYTRMKAGELVERISPLYIIMSGITALFTLLITFLSAATLVGNQPRLYGLNKNIYFLGNIVAFFIVNTIIFFVAQILIGWFSNTTPVIAANIIYCITISVLGLISTKLKSESGIILLALTSFLTCCVFGDIFFNASEVFTNISWISYLAPTHYYIEMIKAFS